MELECYLTATNSSKRIVTVHYSISIKFRGETGILNTDQSHVEMIEVSINSDSYYDEYSKQ